MARERPINADVPADGPGAEKAGPTEAPKPAAPSAPPPPPAPRRRRQVPGALKGIAALVLLAIVFIVAAVIGGSGGSGEKEPQGPAPVTAGGGREGAKAPAAQAPTELGYPGFATNNTTRIGGSDAAENAAATALAVFPATTASQRPEAVVLADEGSWQAALAASVLMASPLRAPLLLSSADELPDASAEALEALDPAGGPESGGTAIFAIGRVAGAEGRKTTRIAPGDPAAMAAAIAELRDRLLGDAPAAFVLAPEAAPAFAMPAAAWAARSGDPVLFSAADKLPKATAEALKRHAKAPVYVLGPSSAISSAVVREIEKGGTKVHRVSGEDPVANAIAFARYANGGFGWNVNDPGHGFVLARDEDPLDAAAAAPLSASGTWGPLLLSDSAATLPPAVRDYFLDVKPGYTNDPTRAFYNHVWVIGDQEAIDVNQQAEVNELAELAKIGGEE
ncbi:MAG TPA: cell wall-binding repeat-containing protein [Solirubrobacterales bacterium]|nr:cell wall-binding repeat-containing protein [Solirubrobacterales bacterium]